jgi:hypothetical protein
MFHPQYLRGTNPTIIFLNQCSGCAPELDVSSVKTKDSINVKDGCFECSTVSPDQFRLPAFAGTLFNDRIPADFPTNFYTKSLDEATMPKIPKMPTPIQYQRHVLPSLLQTPPKKKSNSSFQGNSHPPWTSPPDVYNFQDDHIEFRVVYVEDSEKRILVEKQHLGMVAIPFLETVEK